MILKRNTLVKHDHSNYSSNVRNIYQGLNNIRNKLQAGKRRAERRHKFMEEFLEEFYEEWDGRA